VAELSRAGITVSMFIDPEPRQVEASAEIGAPCVELHTGAYADQSGHAREAELERLLSAARLARASGLQVNAGHGLSLDNLGPVLQMPGLDTLNIGHSIVCRAVFTGLEKAVVEMLERMSK
ncbi:MAG: pyridoxine 5'-phosphate synthase, partial [Kiritimatiellae bacterium]|nr:pyridoxine 5'-phosphate synthase [Kiritimatiellia bacterium]